MYKVAHLTSAHSRTDIRIFLKQCVSLANAGHKVSLVVADGEGDQINGEVQIYDVGPSRGRLDRMRNAPGRVLLKAIALDADVFHLHDPELLPIGLKLKKLGKKVVFDAHEDLPQQLLTKNYLHPSARFLLSKVFGAYERWACRKLDAVVAATPYIRDKFLAIGVRCTDINNFPLSGELASGEIDWSRKVRQVCYVGGISSLRGILNVVNAMAGVESGARLQLVGKFAETDTRELAMSRTGWQRVDAVGWVDRAGVRAVLDTSVGGLVTFLPVPNHIYSQPNKMFEYMSAGVPVIASDFPLWKEIVEGNDCGICVDPFDPVAIAGAIDFLVNNPVEAERMGRNGQRAVDCIYNWTIEEAKLLQFYESLGT